MIERGIREEWVFDVLTNWVARKWDEFHGSMNYYGFIHGRRHLLKVAVSAESREVFTVHFDSAATRRYHRQRSFFDEVRDVP